MAGILKTNEVKLVSPDGLTEKSITMDNSGIVYIDGKEKANVTQEAWIAPTLLNSWVNYGSSTQTAKYYKDSLGIVHIKGLVKSGVAGTILTLPVGYRPSEQLHFSTVSNSVFGWFTIETNGNLVAQTYNNTFVSIICTFKAEQ